MKLASAGLGGLCPRCLFADGLAADEPGAEAPAAADSSNFSNPFFQRSFGDYDLLEEVARGGMGVVYRARQRSLSRIVALKVLSSGEFASPEYVRRFQAEATAAARLQHPNIVAIHEVGEHDGVRFFTMDFVEGPNLGQLMAGRTLPPERAAGYLKTIAEAIHHAHHQGILHRDLKPSNVLIDPFGEPRVTDFGLAKEITGNSDLTVTGQVLGTPGYLPPEQADTTLGPLTPAADVYSLGAILYYMLTARAPFVAGSMSEMLRQVLADDPVAPRLLNPEVPRDLETVCLKCLDRNPARRYPTAAALAEDLGRFLAHEPIMAQPVSAIGRFSRWCRRRPALAAAWLLAVTLAVGSTVSALGIARALTKVRAAEATGRERLRGAKLAEARAVRHTTVPGRRAEALAALAEAAKIRPGPDLRDEALAALLLPDIRPVDHWELTHPGVGRLTLDPAARLVAYEPVNGLGYEKGEAQLRRWGQPEIISRLAFAGTNRAIGPLRFSADGSLVMARYLDECLRVWRTDRSEPVLVLTNRPLPSGTVLTEPLNDDYDFSPDGTTLALGLAGGGVSVHRVADGAEIARWTGGGLANVVRFAPDGRRLVAFRVLPRGERRVFVLKLPELAEEQALDFGDSPGGVDWSADSRLLAVTTLDKRVVLYDVPGRRQLRSLLCPGVSASEVVFLGNDRLLGLRGVGTTLRLFSPDFSREELVVDGYGSLQMARQPGATTFVIASLEDVLTRYEVVLPTGFRVLSPPHPAGYDMAFNNCCLDFSPDGRWVVSSHGRFTLLRELAGGRLLDELDSGDPDILEYANVAFCDEGRAVLRCSSRSGLQRHPLVRGPDGSVRIGPGVMLDPEPWCIMTDHTPGGGRLALVRPEKSEVKVVDVFADHVEVRQRWRQTSPYSAALDPAGATVLVNGDGSESTIAQQHLRLYRLADGSTVMDLPANPAGEAVWSADGRIVLTSNSLKQSTLWDAKTWKAKVTLEGSLGGNVTTLGLAPDSSYAIVARDELIQLVSTVDGSLLGAVESPAASGLASGIRFLPDHRRFAVLWRDGRIDVIDPDELKAGLAKLGLGW